VWLPGNCAATSNAFYLITQEGGRSHLFEANQILEFNPNPAGSGGGGGNFGIATRDDIQLVNPGLPGELPLTEIVIDAASPWNANFGLSWMGFRSDRGAKIGRVKLIDYAYDAESRIIYRRELRNSQDDSIWIPVGEADNFQIQLGANILDQEFLLGRFLNLDTPGLSGPEDIRFLQVMTSQTESLNFSLQRTGGLN
jgi:hypothetical protein